MINDPDQTKEPKGRQSMRASLPRTFSDDPEVVIDRKLIARLQDNRDTVSGNVDLPESQGIHDLTYDEFSWLDTRARRLADERRGTRPHYGVIPVGIFAYALTSGAPWFGLQTAGVMNPALSLPLVVTGLVSAAAAGYWQHNRWNQWFRAQHEAFNELLDKEHSETGVNK